MVDGLFPFVRLNRSLFYEEVSYRPLALRSLYFHVIPGESLRLVLHNVH
jgi:hypothetical protein